MASNILKKIVHERNYTIIDNKLLRNPKLSAKAKGLACYLLSLPDDWVIVQEELVNHFTDKISSIQSGLKELKLAGYMLVVSVRDKAGKIMGWQTLIREDLSLPFPSIDGASIQKWKNHILVLPDVANPQLLSTEDHTKDLSNEGLILGDEQKTDSTTSGSSTEVSPSKNSLTSAEPRTAIREKLIDTFNVMWKTYPIKKGKQEALRAFLSKVKVRGTAKELETAKMITGGFTAYMQERYAEIELEKQGADIFLSQWPHLATWLNKDRWLDEHESPESILSKARRKKNLGLDLAAIEQQAKAALAAYGE